MKFNQFDNLNYQKAKRQPLDDIAEGYKKRNPMKEEVPSDSIEALRKLYNADPNSLNPTQLLILGMSELQKKNKEEMEKRQKAVNDYMNPYNAAKKQDEEMISARSEEFEQLARQMQELQKAFAELNGGGE
ncbi:hypothetical protein ACWM35_01345 [Neobacillus sp. K501]